MEGRARKAGIIILGIGAMGLLITIGCGPRSPFEGKEQAWSSWKKHHGFHEKDFPEHVLKHVDERVKALNLTKVQKEQVAVIRQKTKSVLTSGRDKRRSLMANIRNEMNRDLPDLHEVAGKVSEHLRTLPGTVDEFMGLFLDFYEILDDAQKGEVIEHLRDRLNRIPLKAAAGGGSTEAGADISSGSLSDQMAQKKGDRNGELL